MTGFGIRDRLIMNYPKFTYVLQILYQNQWEDLYSLKYLNLYGQYTRIHIFYFFTDLKKVFIACLACR